jgi:hypothetical protein
MSSLTSQLINRRCCCEYRLIFVVVVVAVVNVVNILAMSSDNCIQPPVGFVMYDGSL